MGRPVAGRGSSSSWASERSARLGWTFRSTTVIFFFNDTATTEIYTLSLHDALPISHAREWIEASGSRGDLRSLEAQAKDRGGIGVGRHRLAAGGCRRTTQPHHRLGVGERSEEHTSELQSRLHLVCRLLLEKKKKKTK